MNGQVDVKHPLYKTIVACEDAADKAREHAEQGTSQSRRPGPATDRSRAPCMLRVKLTQTLSLVARGDSIQFKSVCPRRLRRLRLGAVHAHAGPRRGAGQTTSPLTLRPCEIDSIVDTLIRCLCD